MCLKHNVVVVINVNASPTQFIEILEWTHLVWNQYAGLCLKKSMGGVRWGVRSDETKKKMERMWTWKMGERQDERNLEEDRLGEK